MMGSLEHVPSKGCSLQAVSGVTSTSHLTSVLNTSKVDNATKQEKQWDGN
jgi:hypothetical protein